MSAFTNSILGLVGRGLRRNFTLFNTFAHNAEQADNIDVAQTSNPLNLIAAFTHTSTPSPDLVLDAKVVALAYNSSTRTMTAGTPVTFRSLNTSLISVASLTSTRALVSYLAQNQSDSLSTTMQSVVVDVSGTTVTPNAAISWATAGKGALCSIPLNDMQTVVVFTDNANKLAIARITVNSGSSLTIVTTTGLTTGDVAGGVGGSKVSGYKISGNTIIIAYNENLSSTNYMRVATITINSDGTATLNTPATLATGAENRYITLSQIDARTAALSFSISQVAKLAAITINGTAVTAGTVITPSIGTPLEVCGCALSSLQAAALTTDNSGTARGLAYTAIGAVAAAPFSASTMAFAFSFMTAFKLDPSTLAVIGKNGATSYLSSAIIGVS